MLRRGGVAAAIVLAGLAGLLVLGALHARGLGVLILAFAVQGLAAGWLTRAWSAAALPPATALLWSPVADALADVNSDLSLGLVLLICLGCSLAGVVTAVLGAFVARERAHGSGVLPGAALALLLVASGVAGGCGGSTTGPAGVTVRSAAPGARPSAPAATRPRPRTLAARVGRARAPSPVPGRRLPGGPRPPARTLPDGAVVVPPPAPKAARQLASRSCARVAVERGGAQTTLDVPPAPGLRAEQVGDVLRVTVDTGHPPRRCAPDYLSIAAVSGSDLRAPISRDVRIRQLGVQTVTLPLAGATVDRVRATAGTDAGHVSPTSWVALRR